MAIATALSGFNDLGHSVTPKFLSRNRFYLQLSTNCPKMNKNWAWEVKKIQYFCPRDIESCHLATARWVKLWSLIAIFGAYRHFLMVFFGACSLPNEVGGTPFFFYLFGKSRSLPFCIGSLKKICAWELLGANVLNIILPSMEFNV